MEAVDVFLAAPSVDGLRTLTKEQLFKVADHFELEVPKTVKKAELVKLVEDGLIKREILSAKLLSASATPVGSGADSRLPVSSLTFEQQVKLMEMQLERDKYLEREREKDREERAKDRDLQYKKLQQDYEHLKLLAEGRAPSGSVGGSASPQQGRLPLELNLSNIIKLLPKFNERDPDTFFSLFEILAADHAWTDSERVLLLQSVIFGKAQEAFIALTDAQRKRYISVKNSILKAYELVPEAYRQKFRNWRKSDRQTHLELGRELTTLFNRWRTSEGVDTFEKLCDLVVLEQFKNIVPARIATYINEHNVKTAAEAASLADKYTLTHRQRDYAQSESRPHRFSVPRHGPPNDRKQPDAQDLCRYCFERGHWKNECPVIRSKRGHFPVKPTVCVAQLFSPGEQVCSTKPSVLCGDDSVMDAVSESTDLVTGTSLPGREFVSDCSGGGYGPFITAGFVSLGGNGEKVPVKILRDTGASESFVLESVLPFSDHSNTGTCVLICGIEMHTISVPLHRVILESDLVKGEVALAVRPSLPVEGVHVILGNNLAGGLVWPAGVAPPVVNTKFVVPLEPDQCAVDFPDVFVSCAVTRAMSRAEMRGKLERLSSDCVGLDLPVLPPTLSREEVAVAQKEDKDLAGLFTVALSQEEMRSAANGYSVVNDLLVRKWSQNHGEVVDPIVQIVVPKQFRDVVLRTAHGDVAGHFGIRKTYQQLLLHFYWPGMKRDVVKFIKCCHACQLTGKPNQAIKPVPLCPIPAVGKPFEHLIIDCVGPLPPSKSGCTYLLTVMCQSTRYPAAYPIRSITTKAVVRALTQFISIFGIPKVIQSDRGTNFTSKMFRCILKQLRVKQQLSSPYHPQSQGALERFHLTLKSLLRAYCLEMKKDWEEGVPWMLLAARGVVQDSTGFSPNELVFAHQVRGPLSVLKDGLEESQPPVNLVDFVNGFRRRLTLAWKMASDNLTGAQSKMKKRYDRRAVERGFSPGDQVLALLPMPSSLFSARFSGPYTVMRQLSECDYLLATPDRKRSTQVCHVNLLKPYFSPGPSSGGGSVSSAAVAVVGVPSHPLVAADVDEVGSCDLFLQPRLKNSESLSNLDRLMGHLSAGESAELKALILSHQSLFSDTPSCTDTIEHDIDTGEALPIRQRFYRVGPEKRKILDKEVKYLLDHGLAEPSHSSWASPCLLVGKPDNTFRFCTDYRKVNRVTKADSFPLPRVDDCIDQVGAARYVSKFDLLKGYYQVPLTPRAQEVSAFVTPSGLYSYKVMSFGLRNAPATFQRLMNRVISGLQGCTVYLDDAVLVSDTWGEHLVRIRAFFERLLQAKLTVNLAKCEFARATVVYLGKVVGQGQVRPVRAKVLAIDKFPAPTTRKELQRFLGMVGYYRSFCRNFSTVVCPLTDLLKEGVKFVWSADCQKAFENVKMLLTTAPVLAAPRLDRECQLQVDASSVGAGAVLLQVDEEGVTHPVCYFSKKFNKHQACYSTIEKEALALVWALRHFEVYVESGVQPLIVYSDHNPLTFLHTLQNPNQRLMRWALFLQPYHLDIRHIRGVDNVVADALSRSCENV
ncbi:hypothetical protein ACEWY4_027272 [Coilia grayii]|uniref:Gypsy retrotransposon integrase-like protein 1 n=1 Tax=Coilia grayii TaxID=363190 RepID=A0ABD1IRZ2_9TELE